MANTRVHDNGLEVVPPTGLLVASSPSSAVPHSEGNIHYSQDKILAPAEGVTDYPELVAQENYPIPVNAACIPYGVYPQMAKPDETERSIPRGEELPQKATRCCGLSRKISWMVGIAVALFLLGALIGGLVGGLGSAKRRDTAEESNSRDSQTATGTDGGHNQEPPNANQTIFRSKIAALNYTDESATMRRAIFYQRETGSLWLSLHHPRNNSWTQFNISDTFASKTDGGYRYPKAGTPLAASALPRGNVNAVGPLNVTMAIGLFYLDAEGRVHELNVFEETLREWKLGGLSRNAIIYAYEESQVSAVGYFCPGGHCSNTMCIAYQREDRNLYYRGTPLAFIPTADEEGRNVTQQSSMRLYYYASNEIWVDALSDGQWWIGAEPVMTSQELVNATMPLVVAAPAGASNGNILVISMMADGAFTGSLYTPDDGWDQTRSLRFINEDGESTDQRPDSNLKFTGIALNHDGWFYGITEGGIIVEYAWDGPEEGFSFSWRGSIDVF
ncbi:hypothetical protein DL767_009127 [Monosporascus sp. MG133]|nr:hypothetical protein DL767_009127 [Monosporascus sp. MG133]